MGAWLNTKRMRGSMFNSYQGGKWVWVLWAVLLILSGCAEVPARKMEQVKVGMTKAEVIAVMGKPAATAPITGRVQTQRNSTGESDEYFKYLLVEKENELWNWWNQKPYFVSFSEDKVDAFGKLADFDSGDNSPQTQKNGQAILPVEGVKTSSAVETDIPEKLRALKRLESEGVITHDDFEKQKKKLLEDYTQGQPR